MQHMKWRTYRHVLMKFEQTTGYAVEDTVNPAVSGRISNEESRNYFNIYCSNSQHWVFVIITIKTPNMVSTWLPYMFPTGCEYIYFPEQTGSCHTPILRFTGRLNSSAKGMIVIVNIPCTDFSLNFSGVEILYYFFRSVYSSRSRTQLFFTIHPALPF